MIVGIASHVMEARVLSMQLVRETPKRIIVKMKINVTKLTDIELLRKANSFTTGKDSKMTLANAYKYGHSPIRTQLFWIELRNIPLFVASQLVRSHVGVQFFQRSKRTDRGGENFKEVCENIAQCVMEIDENDVCASNRQGKYQQEISDEIKSLSKRFDRLAPTDLACLINAEALINMAHKRLCSKASEQTRELMKAIVHEVAQVDPDLAHHMVPMCAYMNGVCREPHGCGLNKKYKDQSN